MKSGQTPLYTSSEKGFYSVCDLLLNKRADVNKLRWYGIYYTITYSVVNCSYWYFYHILKSGQTPLYIASKEGHVSVCDLLLNRGADVDKTERVWDILYYIILYYTCVSVIDIIIYYRGDGHLCTLQVICVISAYATFSLTGSWC